MSGADIEWQITAAASLLAAVPVGLALRALVNHLDRRREHVRSRR